jgi:hypothetical protein
MDKKEVKQAWLFGQDTTQLQTVQYKPVANKWYFEEVNLDYENTAIIVPELMTPEKAYSVWVEKIRSGYEARIVKISKYIRNDSYIITYIVKHGQGKP